MPLLPRSAPQRANAAVNNCARLARRGSPSTSSGVIGEPEVKTLPDPFPANGRSRPPPSASTGTRSVSPLNSLELALPAISSSRHRSQRYLVQVLRNPLPFVVGCASHTLRHIRPAPHSALPSPVSSCATKRTSHCVAAQGDWWYYGNRDDSEKATHLRIHGLTTVIVEGVQLVSVLHRDLVHSTYRSSIVKHQARHFQNFPASSPMLFPSQPRSLDRVGHSSNGRIFRLDPDSKVASTLDAGHAKTFSWRRLLGDSMEDSEEGVPVPVVQNHAFFSGHIPGHLREPRTAIAPALDMDGIQNIPPEIISQIFRITDPGTLKCCRLVCRRWEKIAVEFLFRRVVYDEVRTTFNAILAKTELAAFVRFISIPRTTANDVLRAIACHKLGLEILRPKAGIVRQSGDGQFITTVTDFAPSPQSILPALEEIRLLTSDEPLFAVQVFPNLRRLHVDMEFVQLANGLEWPRLEALHLRGTFSVVQLQDFLARNKSIRQIHLTAVLALKPLKPPPGSVRELIKAALGSVLSAENVGSIMRSAEDCDDAHERSFLRQVHADLDKMTDQDAKSEAREAIVTNFGVLLAHEANHYLADIGKLGLSDSSSLHEVTFSAQYAWEDELVIRGSTLRDGPAPEIGLRATDQVEDTLHICHTLEPLSEQGAQWNIRPSEY
ncbi:hypothetical protein Purlil1_13156 [Purpureocillium lilacinum]|uniref:F-box domain-containing protein n=1 Tax=Purpureocillium lilacinum TaxID=33203 RepID=A0ABR0BEV5_PURLI|nr:hypothetical protein Purlil1_13156 [Purpureocillium lilacinum]